VDKVNNAAKALEEEVFGAAVKLGFKNSEIQQMPKTADGMNVIFSFAFSKALPGNTGTLVQKLRLLNLHHLAADDLLAKREKSVQALQAIIERAELVKHVVKPHDLAASKDSSASASAVRKREPERQGGEGNSGGAGEARDNEGPRIARRPCSYEGEDANDGDQDAELWLEHGREGGEDRTANSLATDERGD
jgi:hypothetical protein